jgi:hypothetical protein
MPNTDAFQLLGEDPEPDMETLETLFNRVPEPCSQEPSTPSIPYAVRQESPFQEKACPVCGGSRAVFDPVTGMAHDCPERCWEIES